MAGHRYWRVRGLELNSGLMAATNVELREVLGGPTVTGSGTAIASSYYSAGYEPANAFDGSSSPWASSGGGAGVQWIGYDFGSGVTKDIMQVAYTGRDSGSSNQSPWFVAIEYSDDGSTWTTLFRRYTLSGWGNYTTEVYTVPSPIPLGANPHRYWRIEVLSSYSNPSGASELEFAYEPGGINLSHILSFTWSWSSNYGGYPPSQLFDYVFPPADNQFLFNSDVGTIDLDCDAEFTLSQITWYARQGFPSQSPATGRVRYSDDGSTWTTAWTFSFGSWSAGEGKTVYDPGYVPPTPTDRRRQGSIVF
jgi:hypothetical protein